jgi:CheY-like chemotaxis protein
MKENQRIYYLDDDIDDLHIFQDVAEGLGHKVSIFISGNEMLRALNNDPLPDIIFLDIHMPVFNGEEILNVIKNNESWKQVPVVMISGAYPKKLVRYYLEVGANYLMKKPVYNDLKSSLAHVLSIDWTNFQAFA